MNNLQSFAKGSTNVTTLDTAYSEVSDKYKLVKTNDMIEKLKAQGFKLESFVANKVKKVERQGFQKHRAVFSHDTLLKGNHVDGIPQLVLTNSHDGTSSVVLQLGFFRLICSNGLMVGKTVGNPIRLRHSGKNIYEQLDRGVERIVAQLTALNDAIDKMKAKVLTDSEIRAFQEKALSSRVDANIVKSFNFSINRPEDKAKDLFTVMNVIQENLIRGGATMIVDKGNDRTGLRTLRPIRSIAVQSSINTDLWDSAMSMVA